MQTSISDYSNLRKDGARTWIPLPEGEEGFEFEEVVLQGGAHLAMEAILNMSITQQLIINQLSGPVGNSALYGTLHVGPNQYAEIMNTPYFFPSSVRTYTSSVLVIPQRLQFHRSNSTFGGTIGGLRELVVSGGSLSLQEGISTLSFSGNNTLHLNSLEIKGGAMLSARDGTDWISLNLGSLDLTSGALLEGRKLFVDAQRLTVEATAELSVSGGGYADNGRGECFKLFCFFLIGLV